MTRPAKCSPRIGLLAKCASRYESAPEKYKDTPGYKASAKQGA